MEQRDINKDMRSAADSALETFTKEGRDVTVKLTFKPIKDTYEDVENATGITTTMSTEARPTHVFPTTSTLTEKPVATPNPISNIVEAHTNTIQPEHTSQPGDTATPTPIISAK